MQMERHTHAVFVCVFNSEHGPFVDAWIQLQDGSFPGERNPTVQPRYMIDQPFDFVFPDGEKMTVILKESPYETRPSTG